MPSSRSSDSQTESVPYVEQNSSITLWICRCLQGFWECEWMCLVMFHSHVYFKTQTMNVYAVILASRSGKLTEMLTLVLPWRYATNKEVWLWGLFKVLFASLWEDVVRNIFSLFFFILHVGCGWMVSMPALCLEGPLFNPWPRGQL